MKGKLTHGFLIEEIDRFKEFYTKMFGYTVSEEYDDCIYLDTDSPLGLYARTWESVKKYIGKEVSKINCSSMCTFVYDSQLTLEEEYRELSDRGMCVLKSPESLEGCHAAFLADDKGYLWELCTRKKTEVQE